MIYIFFNSVRCEKSKQPPLMKVPQLVLHVVGKIGSKGSIHSTNSDVGIGFNEHVVWCTKINDGAVKSAKLN